MDTNKKMSKCLVLFPNLHSIYRFLETKKIILDASFSIFGPEVAYARQIVACICFMK
jgi:hypothetical protein